MMSQSLRTILALRDLILSGELKAGERLSELAIVDRLGVSRTPVRTALLRLEEEGLLEAIPSGGYTVRHFSEADIFDAIETRGTLEGLAARLAAERGPSPGQIGEIRSCLRKLDLLVQHDIGAETFSSYVELNDRTGRSPAICLAQRLRRSAGGAAGIARHPAGGAGTASQRGGSDRTARRGAGGSAHARTLPRSTPQSSHGAGAPECP